MRKLVALIILVCVLGGTAMAINNGGVFGGKRAANNTRTQVQAQVENLVDIATVEPTATPVVTEAPVATPVVTAAPVATPAPVNPLRLDAEEGFRLMQNNEYGACNALFVDSGVQYERVELVWTHDFEVEVMVAGSYVSIVADGYSFTGTKDAKANVTIEECDIHDGVFFNWTTRYKGEKVRFTVTEEVVEEINKFFGCWENGQLTYGLLCDRHDGSGSVAHSNAGNGNSNGNGGEQPVKPTATPAPTTAPTQAPTTAPTTAPTQAPTLAPLPTWQPAPTDPFVQEPVATPTTNHNNSDWQEATTDPFVKEEVNSATEHNKAATPAPAPVATPAPELTLSVFTAESTSAGSTSSSSAHSDEDVVVVEETEQEESNGLSLSDFSL